MGTQYTKGVETYDYGRSREHVVAVTSWTGTYRLSVTEHGDIGPDEVQKGGVPVLQHRQARCNLKYSRDHTATNSTNTVEQPYERFGNRVR